MLGEGRVYPTIAVKDIDKAKEFYGGTLGLLLVDENAGGVTFDCGGGTSVFVYPSANAGTNQATYAGWGLVDFDGTLAALKEKGVEFEHYADMPGVTRDGDVHVMDEFRMAWFRDPDGNILAIDNNP